jgi:hypothetical protein
VEAEQGDVKEWENMLATLQVGIHCPLLCFGLVEQVQCVGPMGVGSFVLGFALHFAWRSLWLLPSLFGMHTGRVWDGSTHTVN